MSFTKVVSLFIIAVITLLLSAYIFFLNFQTTTNAALDTPVIEEGRLDDNSYVNKQGAVGNFFIASGGEQPLMLSRGNGFSAALDIVRRDPQVVPQPGAGVTNNAQTLLPENIAKNITYVTSSNDQQDPYLIQNGIDLNQQHFYYEQKLGGETVYGSRVAVHLKDANQMYAMNGNVVYDETVPTPKITDEQATAIALDAAHKQAPTAKPQVQKTERMVFNKKLVGVGTDEKNYNVLVVSIADPDNYFLLNNRYFVNLDNGEVLFNEAIINEALNRMVYTCNNSLEGCTPARPEGTAAVSDTDVNKAYDAFGVAYNYFSNSFQRDGWDNRGVQISALVHACTVTNAAYVPATQQNPDFVFICNNMVWQDVLTHEYTHGVTNYTAKLPNYAQGGAINEAVSDIFALVQKGSWEMGGDGNPLPPRYADNPGLGTIPGGRSYPDRLFAANYYCPVQNVAQCTDATTRQSIDSCGVHINMTVITHAFYLASVGGSFNGCNLSGVGNTKAINIEYYALTHYLQQTDNFSSYFTKINQACTDLYGSEPDTCTNVRRAMEATELDQQPANDSLGAKCTGVQAQPATCVASNAQPTAAPTAVPIATATSVPTAVPTVVPDTPAVTVTTPTLGPSPTPAPIVTPGYTPPPPPETTPGTNVGSNNTVSLTLRLKFQGITGGVPSQFNQLPVKVKAIGNGGSSNFQVVNFTGNASGVWTGTYTVPDVHPGTGFAIYVKGPKQLQKKICDAQPSESALGQYQCTNGRITLNGGGNVFDFTGVTQIAGDVPQQDGILNSYDISVVRSRLGKTDATALSMADLNLDGIVDGQDYALLVAAISSKYDEGTPDQPVIDQIPLPTPIPQQISQTPITSAPLQPSTPPGQPTSAPQVNPDLVRNGSTYPFYASLVFNQSCTQVSGSSIPQISAAVLGKSASFQNVPLTDRTTGALYFGDINVNDLMAQDLHVGDATITLNPQAQITMTAPVSSTRSLVDTIAHFGGGLAWCNYSQGCQGSAAFDRQLEGKKYIFYQRLVVDCAN